MLRCHVTDTSTEDGDKDKCHVIDTNKINCYLTDYIRNQMGKIL